MGTTVYNDGTTDSFAYIGNSDDIWWRPNAENQLSESDAMDVDIVAKRAGLDFEVRKAQVNYTATMADGSMQTMQFDNRMVTYCTDNGLALGTVSGNKYHIVQPRKVVEFFRDALATEKLRISTAGALAGRKIVWCLAELGDEYNFILPGNDMIRSYIRMQTSFDGSRTTSACATTIRQVCENTEAMVEYQTKDRQYRVAHSKVLSADLARQLQHAIGLLGEQHQQTAEVWNTLCNTSVSTETANRFFCDLLKVDYADVVSGRMIDGKPAVSTKTVNQLKTLSRLYLSGPGANLPSAKNTAYGLLQSVTRFVDHEAATRDTNGDGKQASRLASAWYGAGAQTKLRARELCMELAGMKVAA